MWLSHYLYLPSESDLTEYQSGNLGFGKFSCYQIISTYSQISEFATDCVNIKDRCVQNHAELFNSQPSVLAKIKMPLKTSDFQYISKLILYELEVKPLKLRVQTHWFLNWIRFWAYSALGPIPFLPRRYNIHAFYNLWS